MAKTLEEQAIDVERAKRKARRIINAEEYGQITQPDILTLRERLARPHPEIAWRISKLQHTGHRIMTVAQWKTGKTSLISNLMRSLADGDPFLNMYETVPVEGVIVLLDTEMEET